MNWTPLHCHSTFSLLDGFSSVKEILSRCQELGYQGCALTDHGNISGCVKFSSAFREAGLKPILGSELYITKDLDIHERKLQHLLCLAKNKEGWRRLVELTSIANDNVYFKPRLSLKKIEEINDGNLIGFSGHLGSTLASCLFEDGKLVVDPIKKAREVLYKHFEAFGRENFFIEVQLIDPTDKALLVGSIMRELAQQEGVKTIATGDSHYARKEDAFYQRLLLCSTLKMTFKQVRNKLNSGEDVPLASFFKTDNFHIPSIEELLVKSSKEEIDNTNLVFDMCEDYSLESQPLLPKIGVADEKQELLRLCREGWNKKLNELLKNDKQLKQTYVDRVKSELDIINGAGLEGYFLVVQDYVNWARNNGILIGPGRGSASGSLVSYLTGITAVDPIPFDLLFSRFYNEGRNKDGHVSLPDIDIDFPTSKRQEVINYIRNKYGQSRVAQIVTFGKLKARAAFKETLRILEACDPATANKITKKIPEESKITDKMKAEEETSVLMYTMKYTDDLKDWVQIDDSGEITGEFANEMKQALKIEGIYKNTGKHAAGIIISPVDLKSECPMIYDKNGDEKLAGFEMDDLEKIGQVKFDILALSMLDLFMDVNNMLKFGDNNV